MLTSSGPISFQGPYRESRHTFGSDSEEENLHTTKAAQTEALVQAALAN